MEQEAIRQGMDFRAGLLFPYPGRKLHEQLGPMLTRLGSGMERY